MLSSVCPRSRSRLESLPVVGRVLDGLCEWLLTRGYPPDAIRRRMAAAPLLEQFLRQRQLRSLQDCTVSDLTSCVPRQRGWAGHMAYALARSLSQYLEECGGQLRSTAPSPTKALVYSFERHLVEVRGLAPATVRKRVARAGHFMESLGYDDQPERLRGLCVSDVDRYLKQVGRRLGRASMVDVAVTLRALLRFLALEGKAPVGLDVHVTSPRLYRGERLPRALPWRDVLKLLETIDRSTAKGRRDYAMLLLIATYGLRRGEVASLDLDHVGWRERQIQVPRPKIGTALVFPLTDEVAAALVEYLRNDRPLSVSRRLFLSLRVPVRPVGPDAITDAFDAWATLAGIRLPRLGGPHCIRHSLAMHLLRQGAGLKTIGDLLGHRSAESTSIYLRLDVEDLRDVALPLPRVDSSEVPR